MDFGSPAFALLAIVDVLASNALLSVGVGIAAYWIALLSIQRAGLLPDYVGTQGPILTLHTKRGRDFLDWLAGPKRFWRAWANLGVGIAVVVMGSMFVFLFTAALAALQSPAPTSVQQPRNVLVIPGVNDFLPLSATPEIVFGLLVGLVVHEGGHGLLCRVEDIDIESMGVALLAVVPVGAFVEPDERSRAHASRGGQTRMFAAGVTNNFAVTILAFALLFGPVVGAVSVAPGAAVGGVMPHSPAENAGIQANDRITAVEGQSIESNADLEETLEATESDTVAVELDGEETTTVERALLVTATVEGGLDGIEVGDTVVAVDGEPIATERDFREAVGDAETVTLTVERPVDGDVERLERTIPVGAYAQVAADGPLAEAGAPADSEFVITAFDGERVTSYEAVSALLDDTEPGEDVTVAGYVDGERTTYDVTLGENERSGSGFLGVRMAPGVAGLSVSDVGVQLYPAGQYLTALGGEGDGIFGPLSESFLGKIVIALFLPIAAVTGWLPFNFAGFTGGITAFYQVQGPLAILGDGVFLLANVLFWTGWINVQLGFFNCIPAFPLDGGHILRTSTEAIVSRLPIDATRGMVRTVTTTVGLTMLISFVLMLFGPGLFAG